MTVCLPLKRVALVGFTAVVINDGIVVIASKKMAPVGPLIGIPPAPAEPPRGAPAAAFCGSMLTNSAVDTPRLLIPTWLGEDVK